MYRISNQKVKSGTGRIMPKLRGMVSAVMLDESSAGAAVIAQYMEKNIDIFIATQQFDFRVFPTPSLASSFLKDLPEASVVNDDLF